MMVVFGRLLVTRRRWTLVPLFRSNFNKWKSKECNFGFCEKKFKMHSRMASCRLDSHRVSHFFCKGNAEHLDLHRKFDHEQNRDHHQLLWSADWQSTINQQGLYSILESSFVKLEELLWLLRSAFRSSKL